MRSWCHHLCLNIIHSFIHLKVGILFAYYVLCRFVLIVLLLRVSCLWCPSLEIVVHACIEHCKRHSSITARAKVAIAHILYL